MGKIRVGFVGAGNIGREHAKALSHVDDAEIVGVTDALPDAARALAESVGATAYPSVKELTKEGGLDALFILLPPFAHGDAERAALEHQIPFFIEKPVGLDRGLCREIAAEVERKDLITSVGYMTRYRKSVQRAKELLAEEPGILAYGGWWGGTPGAGASWWPDKSRSGGQFHEQATHTVDLARYLLGEAVEVYSASAKGFVKDLPGYSMDDAVTVAIKFQSGAVANLMASVTSNAGGRIFMNVHSMHRNFAFREWEHDLTISQKGSDPEEIAGEPNIFAVEDAAFIEAVRLNDRSKVLCPYADGVKSALISLAANESLVTGRPVEV